MCIDHKPESSLYPPINGWGRNAKHPSCHKSLLLEKRVLELDVAQNTLKHDFGGNFNRMCGIADTTKFELSLLPPLRSRSSSN